MTYVAGIAGFHSEFDQV